MNQIKAGPKLGHQSKWLDVQTNQKLALASSTNSQLITLCDLKNDDYNKLILAEIPEDKNKQRSKLKVFKGIGMVSEHSLPGIPTSLVSFYTEESTPKTPIIAASIDSFILFYRNMKPYFKFTVPSLPINAKEEEIWRKLPIQLKENRDLLIEQLKSIPLWELTPMSQKLFELHEAEKEDYIKQHADKKLERLPNITAMTTLLQTSPNVKPPSCLVLATDHGDILILDPQIYKIIYRGRISSEETIASKISISGYLDTDFIIIASTKEGSIYLLRKSWREGREIVQADSPITNQTLLPVDQTIVITTEDQTMLCYSKKGKNLWTVELDSNAKCMASISLPHLGLTLICVALSNQKVQFYSQKLLVDELKVTDNVLAMIFGRLGQEDYVLTLVTTKGDILVKILKRTAEFSEEIKIETPENRRRARKQKETSKFWAHGVKNREEAIAAFNSNQAELLQFRLTVARAAVETLHSSESTISGSFEEGQIKLAAEVCGMGPDFRLYLTLENISAEKAAPNLRVLLMADARHYALPKPTAALPIIVPGMSMKIDFPVIALLDSETYLPPPTLTDENANIRVIIFKTGLVKPLIAAVIDMPSSEAPLEA